MSSLSSLLLFILDNPVESAQRVLDPLHGADRIVGVDVRGVGSRAPDEKVRHGRDGLPAAKDFESLEGGVPAQGVVVAVRHHGAHRRIASPRYPWAQGRAPSRLRKKGIPQPTPSLWSLPVGREVKESSHLLCRVRNRYIRPGPQESFFPHPARPPQRRDSSWWLHRDADGG